MLWKYDSFITVLTNLVAGFLMTVVFLRRNLLKSVTVHSSSKVSIAILVHFNQSQVTIMMRITAVTDKRASVPFHLKHKFCVSVTNNHRITLFVA